MNHKEKCKTLKKVRKSIADVLGVDLHQTECTYEGDCPGTCPKCKKEEEILNKAILTGSAAAVSSLVLVGCQLPIAQGVVHVIENNVDSGVGGDDLTGVATESPIDYQEPDMGDVSIEDELYSSEITVNPDGEEMILEGDVAYYPVDAIISKECARKAVTEYLGHENISLYSEDEFYISWSIFGTDDISMEEEIGIITVDLNTGDLYYMGYDGTSEDRTVSEFVDISEDGTICE